MKQSKIFLLIFVFLSIAFLFLLYIDKDCACKSYSHSSICPICLQRAHVHSKTIYKITIFRSVKLNYEDVGLNYFNKSHSELPDISANLYEEITSNNCKHDFKTLGGGGGYWGFFHRGVHKDYGGGYTKRLYGQRITAIEDLYAAYLKIKNKELARKTYNLIDLAFPMDEDKLRMANDLIYKGNANKELSDDERRQIINNMKLSMQQEENMYYAEFYRIALKMLEYEAFILRLKEIQNEDEWVELLSDMEQCDEP